MIKFKYFISISIFIFMLILISFVKNQTRKIEKNILNHDKEIYLIQNQLYESQIDYYYLTSPKLLKEKINFVFDEEYIPMDFSKIYSSLNHFLNDKNKSTKIFYKKDERDKKNKVKKNTNQKSFFFEDYLETNLKKKVINQRLVSEDRIYILFFFFLSLIIIFFLKITLLSLQENNFITNNKTDGNLKNLRRDIVDRNQTLLSRNIKSFHAGVRSHLVKDPKKLFVKLKIILPNLNKEKFINDINQKKIFLH